jgi:hypothetical protein
LCKQSKFLNIIENRLNRYFIVSFYYMYQPSYQVAIQIKNLWMHLTILNFVLPPTSKQIKYHENNYFSRNYHTTEQRVKRICCFANFVINLPFHPSLYFNNLTWCENSNLIGLSAWSNIGYAWLVLWRRKHIFSSRQLQIQIVPWNNRGIITFCCQQLN